MSQLTVSTHVQDALHSGRPVVALETTLVTHGLPQPDGFEVARQLEEIVRQEEAVPATIGVLDGRLIVGLNRDELERLASSTDAQKLNLSNLAAGMAARRPGSTTVAASIFAAHQSGIQVFATGGIGGVHRGASTTGDVSADLTALGRYPVAVVCAGAKAVLDLQRTLEALETLGVPVLGVKTQEFPAFYRRDSGLAVDAGYDTMAELAQAVAAHFALRLGSGVLVANPIPEELELPDALYHNALSEALGDLAKRGMKGREVTPFLLDRLRELTKGQSVFSNRGLLQHNATIAARLATSLQI